MKLVCARKKSGNTADKGNKKQSAVQTLTTLFSAFLSVPAGSQPGGLAAGNDLESDENP